MPNLTLAEAQDVIDTFDISSGVPAQITRIDKLTGDFATASVGAFKAAVDRRMDRLNKLLTFLERGKPSFRRGETLAAINRAFGTRLFSLTEISPLVTDAGLADICIRLGMLSAPDRARLTAYFQYVKQRLPARSEPELVVEIARVFDGQLEAGVLDVLDAVRTSAGDVSRVTPRSIAGLVQLIQAFPTRVFPGFTRWGPGNSGSTGDVNFREHFEKHVCNTSLIYSEDAVFWWNELPVTVTLADLVNPTQTEATYFNPDGSLDRTKLDKFINAVVIPRPELIDALFKKYGPAYTKFAFDVSTRLTNVIVETDGTDRVLVNGFRDFIVVFGRFDGPGGLLGLSSCYYVVPSQRSVKLDPNKQTKIWDLMSP